MVDYTFNTLTISFQKSFTEVSKTRHLKTTEIQKIEIITCEKGFAKFIRLGNFVLTLKLNTKSLSKSPGTF